MVFTQQQNIHFSLFINIYIINSHCLTYHNNINWGGGGVREGWEGYCEWLVNISDL